MGVGGGVSGSGKRETGIAKAVGHLSLPASGYILYMVGSSKLWVGDKVYAKIIFMALGDRESHMGKPL